jgi:hypothetical protein
MTTTSLWAFKKKKEWRDAKEERRGGRGGWRGHRSKKADIKKKFELS